MKMIPTYLQWKNTGLQDVVDINFMLPSSTPYRYANMEYNNEYHYPLINGIMSTLKKPSVSTMT